MSNITINTSFALRKGTNTFTWTPNALSITQTGTGGPTPGVRTIGTTEVSETFTELTNEGWVILQNIDATNYVRWGFSTGVYGGRLRPGEYAVFRLNPGTTIFLFANAEACKVVIYGIEF